jgi:ribosomal protein S18 acetylase RimI-like enzyme
MSVVSEKVAVRRMQACDEDVLNRLFVDIVQSLPYYNETAKRSEIAKYTPQLLQEHVKKDPDSVLVAHLDEKLVGFCFSNIDDGLVWLAWFGVHPSYRKHGVGRALLERLDQTVRSRGSHKIWCDCRPENEASKIVLARHGYAALCTVRNHWYGQDFILWEKAVA